MSKIFLNIVNMSISAGYIVLAVLILRLILKKAPKWISVILWGIVALRLVLPFSIESAFSLIPSSETISPEILTDKTPTIHTGIPILNSTLNPIINDSFSPNAGDSANPLQIIVPVLAVIWIIGIVALLIYTAFSYFGIRRKLQTAVLLRDRIYQCQNVASPFVFGVIKPKIYLPFSMNDNEMNHVIAHEQAHISRKDYLWKPLGFLLLSLHWFNPLLWLGYILLCRDIELACDEKVIKKLDCNARADYSDALLTCSINRRTIAACPLAFGEVGVKKRIKSVLCYKKPTFWLVVIAIIACILLAICFLTNPYQRVKDILKPGTYWQCNEYPLSFFVDNNGVIEGTLTKDGNESSISIGYRFAGLRNAVAEVFENNWENAQKTGKAPILSGVITAKNGNLILQIKKNNLGIDNEQLVFVKSSKTDNLIYGFIPPASDGDKLSYVYVEDFGYESDKVNVDFLGGRFNDGEIIFDIGWRNNGDKNISIGPDFEVYKHNGESFEKLEQKGYWLAYLQILAGKEMNIVGESNNAKLGYETTVSYNLSSHYDLSAPGKYRFEAHGAWVDFQIIGNFNLISAVYDSASFDIDSDGVAENCSMRYGHTSGLFTFVFLVQDSKTGAVKYETTFNSPVYELCFKKGIDGVTRVQAITRDENPETHLFDISIVDGNISLTKHGVPIGEMGIMRENNVTLIYDSPVYSFVMLPSDVPSVKIENGVAYTTVEGNTARIGTVEKKAVTPSNFDDWILSYEGFDSSELIKKLRENNEITYEIIPDNDVNGIELYYIMEQKTGESLIVYGHYENGTKENEIRFIYSITK